MSCMGVWLLAACILPADIPPAPTVAASINVTPSHDAMQTVVIAGPPPRIEIDDPRGIGAITLSMVPESSQMTIRLHLHALEQLQIRAETFAIEARGSQGGSVVADATWSDGGQTRLLTAEDPYTLVITAHAQDGTPATTVPLDGGYFDVTLPAALIERASGTLTISWIDFYR